ncbi:site-specific DNA-methyltransferase [Bacteroides xylanisolvens]|uniref:site-specific DNA-methyltransferase n=1 Tax=Bacteroides xylanisolvens TaxID=371601 RepID=UPI00125EE629|nr:site-specific DNA-methyltransferase [Bacteroides xylanisolvens]KAB6443028.1 site-specific DNA-methyltransferase [Bacteroides xylanisolvens]KAB6458738.1 site-specific DNA-methyltransferase [Bacteroides xylanisolvens]
MNKTELYNKIVQLDGLTNEEKSELLGLLRKQKKYGLVWEDKPEDVEVRLRDELPVLIEDATKAIISDDADAPNHILIEGDNLEALTALAYTHEGQIDVIYIDPPYNTGNKDFVYNDRIVDKEDRYRHSKWLSFMNKRLRIAKQLLSDRGVIFISIDDNEQAQLKLLCDEIFGGNNYISTLPRITKASGKTTDKIAQNHDYVLIFAKDESICTITGIPHDDAGFKNLDEFYSKRGKYKLNQALDYDSLSYSASLDYPITINGETFYPGGDYEKHLERLKGNHKRADWAWRWSKELFQFGFDNGFIVVKDGRNGKRIYTKTYQQVTIEKNGNDYQIVEKERIKPVQSIQLIENCFSNDNAKKELGTIFEEIPFDYPKPTSIMHYMLQTIPECSTILDFFAGSGTTLHATMQLNAEDGGHRKCILVTNNENNICKEVTYERNKCVINGYTTPKGEEVAGLKNNTMRYYRTSFVGRSRNMKNMRQLMNLSTDMLCIKEDLYTEQTKFGEQPTYKNVFRYFDDGKKRMMIIYKEEAVLLLADLIRKTDYEGKMRVYVFSPSEDPWEGEFEEVQDKVQLCALPQAIYNAYKRILPKKKDITLEQENNAASNDDKAFNGMLNFDEEEDEQ